MWALGDRLCLMRGESGKIKSSGEEVVGSEVVVVGFLAWTQGTRFVELLQCN